MRRITKGTPPCSRSTSLSHRLPNYNNKVYTHRESISAFVDQSADVNRVNKEGETALHAASKREKIERNTRERMEDKTESPVVDTFSMLLEMGLGPKEDAQQRSAIDVAAAGAMRHCGAVCEQDLIDFPTDFWPERSRKVARHGRLVTPRLNVVGDEQYVRQETSTDWLNLSESRYSFSFTCSYPACGLFACF
jgi:hypothetical protein